MKIITQIILLLFLAGSIFSQNDCTIVAQSTGGGTVSGSGTYPCNTYVTFNAYPNPSYVFYRWTNYTNTVTYSMDASYTFLALTKSGMTLYAAFTYIPPPNYSVNLSSLPPLGGSTVGSGSYSQGTSVTITASPNEGYTFYGWKENGNLISTSISHTFTITANRTFIAVFEDNSQCNLTLLAVPSEGGKVTGAGSYPPNSKVTAQAISNSNYRFTNWSNDSAIVSVNPVYSFQITQNTNLSANFTNIIPVILTANVTPPTGGYTVGGGLYNLGDTVYLTAHPNSGWKFLDWVEYGSQISTDTLLVVIMSNDRSITANFINNLGLDDNKNNGCLVYPNPFSNELTIEVGGKKEKVYFEIINPVGQIVYKGNLLEKIILETFSFSPGAYLIKFENDNIIKLQKVVK